MCKRRLIDPLDGIVARVEETQPTLALPTTIDEQQEWRIHVRDRLRTPLGLCPEIDPCTADDALRCSAEVAQVYDAVGREG